MLQTQVLFLILFINLHWTIINLKIFLLLTVLILVVVFSPQVGDSLIC